MDKRIIRGIFTDRMDRPACPVSLSTCPGNCERCQEYALVSPADLAALEAQLAEARTAVRAYEHVHGEMDACEDCRQTGEGCEKHADALARTWGQLKRALSGDTTQIEQEARVGRAAERWLDNTVYVERLSQYTMGDAIAELRRVIAQAKAGEQP